MVNQEALVTHLNSWVTTVYQEAMVTQLKSARYDLALLSSYTANVPKKPIIFDLL